MTTLAIMVDRVARELRRSNVETQIREAIATAIEAYQHERFFFSEEDTVEIPLVVDQAVYTADDDAMIGRIETLDYVHLLIGSQTYPLAPATASWMDLANVDGQSNGQPYRYLWFGEGIRVYPIPNIADMALRIAGSFNTDAPASDDEANNPWMTKAEALIRCHAKFELFTHVINDQARAAIFDPEAVGPMAPTARALARLRRRSGGKMATGFMEAWNL